MVRESTSTQSSEPTPKSLPRRMFGWVSEGVFILVGAVVIATLLRTFVGQMFVIPSGSMENTLQFDDRVLVAKFGGFQRGDVVVFEDPGDWLEERPRKSNPVTSALEFIGVLPNSSTEHLIKRVIGMPGDHVRINEEGALEVNGHALDESAYLYREGSVTVAPSDFTFDIIVPKDHIFVMGDHRNSSNDSRCRLDDTGQVPGAAAFVPTSKVVGAAVAIVAPLDRAAVFNVPATYKSVPSAEPAPDKPVINHVEPGC